MNNYTFFNAMLVNNYQKEEEARSQAQSFANTCNAPFVVVQIIDTLSPIVPITQRVGSYEDACRVINILPLTDKEFRIYTLRETALEKLKTIATALNDGREPDGGKAYIPTFTMANGRLVYAGDITLASITDQVSFKTIELARYAGNKFIELFNQTIQK